MNKDLQRLQVLMNYLSEIFEAAKQTKQVAQYLKADDIHLEKGATLTINQSQVVIHSRAEQWVEEAKGIIEHLAQITPAGDGLPLKQAWINYRQTIVHETLKKYNGNKLQASKSLGIPRTTFDYWSKQGVLE